MVGLNKAHYVKYLRFLKAKKNISIRRMGCSLITTSDLEWYKHLTNKIVTIETR